MGETIIKATIGRDHYRVSMHAGKNSIFGDEPVANGGGDEGMSPHEILASALGACTCATLRMYADRKEMPLDGVNVVVSLSRDDEKNETNINREIELIGALSGEDKDKLLSIANKCPVHKTLTNPIHINTKIKT